MTIRSTPLSLRWLGAPHQDDLDIISMLGRPDAASPQLPVLARRRVIRSAVGREMEVPLVQGDSAETGRPVVPCASLRPIGRHGHRLRQTRCGSSSKVSVKWRGPDQDSDLCRPSCARVNMKSVKVKMRKSRSEQNAFEVPQQAEVGGALQHFACGPTAEGSGHAWSAR